MLLSSARFEPGKIEVTEGVGLDLILPVATMLSFERLAQWAGKFDIPLKVLGGLVDHADALAALLTGGGAAVAAKFLAKIPKVGPILAPIAVLRWQRRSRPASRSWRRSTPGRRQTGTS